MDLGLSILEEARVVEGRVLKDMKKVVIGLGVVFGLGLAQFDRTALLINVPTAEVLRRGSLAGSFGLTVPLMDPAKSRNSGTEVGAALRFAPIDRLEVGLTAYTLEDYALGATYQVIGYRPEPAGPGEEGEVTAPWGRSTVSRKTEEVAVAVGIHDIGIHNYVSPIGHGWDDAWEDWKYSADYPGEKDRPMENFSGFAVTSIPLGDARLHIGLGRGRYVGFCRGRYINTDYFFDEGHWWAISLFGGLEVNLGEHVTLAVEADGRDVNAGVKLGFGPVSAGVAATKLEGFTPKNPEERFGRIAFMVGYQLDNLCKSRARKPRVEQEPAPEPVPEPEPESVVVELPELAPIYFGLDKSDIRPGDAEILERNAEAIETLVKAGVEADVIIEGHCCPLATNEYNMALGQRRAESARRYLVQLGIDSALLTAISYGEERIVEPDSARYYLNRRCEFKVEEEE